MLKHFESIRNIARKKTGLLGLAARGFIAATATIIACPPRQAIGGVIIIPGQPRGVRLIKVNETTARVTWTDGSSDETRFKVNFIQSYGPLSPSGQGGPSATMTLDHPATMGTGIEGYAEFTQLPPGLYSTSVCAVTPSSHKCNVDYDMTRFGGWVPAPSNVVFRRVGSGAARINWNDGPFMVSPSPAGLDRNRRFEVMVTLPGSSRPTMAAATESLTADIGPLAINTLYPVQVCRISESTNLRACSRSINVILQQGF